MVTHYVTAKPTATLRLAGGETTQLLWGDPLHRISSPSSSRHEVWARGMRGTISRRHVRAASDTFNGLLEIYVIDVGQGDGVLFRTPDGDWHLVDAGVPNSRQMTKKGAANFLRWKFYRDLRRRSVALRTLTASHSDFDHYGGMLDLLSGRLDDDRTFRIRVDDFYHNGMGRFAEGSRLGARSAGEVAPFPNAGFGVPRRGRFITELLDGLDDFRTPTRPFSRSFGDLASLVGSVCDRATRLEGGADRFLPGYGAGSEVEIRVLGPTAERFGNGRVGLRWLENDSVTRNGHSVIYRLDYRSSRILLTGDLNAASQRLHLSYTAADAFAVDVTKGCHHGSEDIDARFTAAMAARATVISSGDNESYAHPRPVVMGASGYYGRPAMEVGEGEIPPLVYSTELARSVNLAYPTSVRLDPDGQDPLPATRFGASRAEVRSRSTSYRRLSSTPIATDLVYGLVNVRTDGNEILLATMKESGNTFDTKLIQAGPNP